MPSSTPAPAPQENLLPDEPLNTGVRLISPISPEPHDTVQDLEPSLEDGSVEGVAGQIHLLASAALKPQPVPDMDEEVDANVFVEMFMRDPDDFSETTEVTQAPFKVVAESSTDEEENIDLVRPDLEDVD